MSYHEEPPNDWICGPCARKRGYRVKRDFLPKRVMGGCGDCGDWKLLAQLSKWHVADRLSASSFPKEAGTE